MNPLHKKLLRTMLRNRGQTIAVVAVILCGIACYICIYSAYLNLALTRDTYYAQNRLADFEIQLERAPETAVFKVETLPGVRKVRSRIVQDVNVELADSDEPRTGRMISMPVPRRDVLNDIVLLEGRYFEGHTQSEVILSERFATENNIAIGGNIDITIDGKKYALRVVGFALSPEYVYMIRNVQELFPNPERFGILWVPEDFAETALNMRSARNNIIGTVDDPEKLDAILDDADELLDSYGVFAKTKKEHFISNQFVNDEIAGLGVTARIIPGLFLGIAAIILLVLLNRMVRTERAQIGLLKAFGYSNFAIGMHYVQYALLLAVAGCLAGFVLGQWLAGGMIKLYVEFYQFPILESRVYYEVLARSMGLSIFFALLGALSAAWNAAQIQPAESMRPEAPPAGQRLWLEKIQFFWRRCSFSWKMILRNVARNKFRASLTVFGAAISTGLLVFGFFMMGTMDFGLKFQFQEVQREDVRVGFLHEHGPRTLNEVARFPHVRRAEPRLEYPFEARHGWRTKDILVVGIPAKAELQKVMTFNRREVPLEHDGIVLSDRLASTLDAKPGDELVLKPLMGRITREHRVRVSRITEQFLGTAAYMPLDRLSRLLDEPLAMNAALLRIDEGSDEILKRELKDVGAIVSVGFTQDAYQAMADTIGESMQITNVMVLIFAGVIAFSIIYNITSVALAERQRELATLRVLGLTPPEVGRILYYENFLLGGAGALLGLPLGLGLCALLVELYDTDLYRLPFHIDRAVFGKSLLLIALYIGLANLAVWRKIRALDLVEVLKERE